MKKIILLMLLPFVLKAQKIKENKKDDMTNKTVIRTSSERLSGKLSSKWIKASVLKINNSWFLSTTISCGGGFFIIRKDADMIIKLSNDSLITLKANNRADAHDGMGGKQADVDYFLTEVNRNALKENGVKKIRFSTTEGYVDVEVSEGNKDIIKTEIKLIEDIK